MEDLIKALQILNKYAASTEWPTHCEHDVLHVTCIGPENFQNITENDEKQLNELGFFFRDDDGEYLDTIMSYRYGSS